MHFDVEQHKDKLIFLTTPLAASTISLADQRRIYLETVLKKLTDTGLDIRMPSSGPNAVMLMQICDEAWILIQSCDPNDTVFFSDIDAIRETKPSKPYSMLTYPDLELVPIRQESTLLTEKRKLTFD